ncbi:SufD family Fe-S cluster assembly protein [Ferrimicrobium sp.]|uniref:SufD family Fe-S cluster assembly protein n=1 Tax=Ferrimicrobium sp. TaxID=2926050 RepID=UPI002605F059|nr:SufD family Fe-S cluster assembly protein [Ferrimicrobium sp.]
MKSLGKDMSWELPARSTTRVAEVERLEQPTEALECWRYSPVDDIDWERYQGSRSVTHDELWARGMEILAGFGEVDATVRVDGGQLIREERETPGLAVNQAEAVGEFLREEDESLLSLGTLLAPGRVEIKVDTPLRRLGILTAGTGDDAALWSWLRLLVAPDVKIEVIHVDLLSGSVLHLPTLEIVGQERSSIVYRHQLEHDQRALSLGYVRFRLATDANLELDAASAHQGYTRVRTDGVLEGTRAQAVIRVGYVVGARERVDYRTFITHDAPSTTSNLLYKGVVNGDGTSIYTGMITITPLGRGSEAFQTNRNVLLSDEALAWSVPNLDIQISDVKCSHASTVGPIDEEELFYLASKGFPAEEARRTLARAFFADMGETFIVEQQRLRAAVDEKWEAGA